MKTQSIPAELHTAARRLRWLRRNPKHAYSTKTWSDEYNLGMAQGYEYALRILLDEYHIKGNHWYDLMYGPMGENPEPSTNN